MPCTREAIPEMSQVFCRRHLTHNPEVSAAHDITVLNRCIRDFNQTIIVSLMLCFCCFRAVRRSVWS